MTSGRDRHKPGRTGASKTSSRRWAHLAAEAGTCAPCPPVVLWHWHSNSESYLDTFKTEPCTSGISAPCHRCCFGLRVRGTPECWARSTRTAFPPYNSRAWLRGDSGLPAW